MSRIVRINEVRDHVFLHVREVLGALQPEARELEWTILALGDTVAAEEPNRLDVLALEDQVQGSDTGLRMTFDELLRLAERFAQVIDALVVGCADASDFPRRQDDDAAILKAATITVAAFDSTFWLVSGPERVVARIRRVFDQVADVPASEVKLSAWDR